jgi:pilus assembly protein Flp/PilA
MRAFAYRLRLDRSGATAIEYGMIAGLVAMVVLAVIISVGTSLTGVNGPLMAAANAMSM